MRGHEYVRATVRDHLAATVPTRLAAIRSALEVDSPDNPPAGAYLLADGLPTDPALFPCVVIMSTGSPTMRRQSATAAGDAGDYVVGYSLTIVVACRTDVAGGEEMASRDRDRLMLAVRESLLGRGSFPADFELLTQDIAEETGAAAQDLRGRPLAAGQLSLGAAVLETLDPIPAPAALEESEITVAAYTASTATITPA